MPCDNSVHHTAFDVDPCVCPELELGDYATAGKVERQSHKSLKQGQLGLAADRSQSKRHRHGIESRAIPDTTQIEPEYVWGDEGPIND